MSLHSLTAPNVVLSANIMLLDCLAPVSSFVDLGRVAAHGMRPFALLKICAEQNGSADKLHIFTAAALREARPEISRKNERSRLALLLPSQGVIAAVWSGTWPLLRAGHVALIWSS